ncbi:MAG: carbamoyl phosphate synthase small subunit, partial [archaeon]
LTKRLREKGVLLGKIVVGKEDVAFFDPNMENLAAKVSCAEPVVYGTGGKKVLLIDCGAKNNIVRSLLNRGVSVIRVPAEHDFFANKIDFDGVVGSNGPGDPKMCAKTISLLRRVLENEVPTFGICLGNQLLALSIGADTYKLKFGHRSQNQPCVLSGTKKCFITSQNHGFAVDKKTLPKQWEEWFCNLNDGTNEGIRHKSKPFMGVQFHPEASPGPLDTAFLFDEFLRELK